VSKNKKQLIELIRQDLIKHADTFVGKIIITCSRPIPIEISMGTVTQRDDMAVHHDEADTIIIHQIILHQIIQANVKSVLVVADDTDVLLCHFTFKNVIKCKVKMVSPKKERNVIETNLTIHLHHGIMKNLLAAHGLTGCDTVATYFGIGKPITVLKLLGNTMHNLDALGNTNNSLDDAIKQAVPFVLSCYGQSACQTMT
jgi:hypothetical protein